MKYTLTNIEVINKTKLLVEIKKLQKDRNLVSIRDFINTLEITKKWIIDSYNPDVELYNMFLMSDNITGKFDKKPDDDYITELENASVIDNNIISNKLGLTHGERWFNSLGDSEKEYVKQLSLFFNPTMIAVG